MHEDLKLPADLARFLGEDRELTYDATHCDCGSVELVKLADLKLETIWVEPDELLEADPHVGDDGLYRVQAVNLTRTAEHFPPEFILLWLPVMECFGTWDCDHYKLWVFADTSWSDIVDRPIPYITAQWEIDGNGVAQQALVWTAYDFILGRPDWEEH